MIKMTKSKLTCKFPREFDKLADSYVPYETMIILPGIRSKHLSSILPLLFVSGVYFLCSEKEIIYIGVSRNIGQRLFDHSSYSGRKDGLVYSAFIRYKDDINILAIEAELIRFFRPIHNRANGIYGYCSLPEDFNIEEFSKNIKEVLGFK